MRYLLVFLGATLSLFFGACLFAQRLLTIDSGPVHADVLVILGGGMYDRPARAAALFREGVAPRILITGTGDAQATALILREEGVPSSVITIENLSSNTLQNARFSAPLLRQMNAHHVILVTSWFHSRRALACFEHFSPSIRFYSRPSYLGYSWGQSYRLGIIHFIPKEFVKILGYGICYGITPFV